MFNSWAVRGAMVGVVLTMASLALMGADEGGAARLRIGTYDPRAVAIAFAPSKYNEAIIRDLQERLDKAKAAGDRAAEAELRREGQSRQERMHRQGFEGAPVDDLLAHVQDLLPGVCEEAGVQAIVRGVIHARPEVEVVDVTDALVRVFYPNEKALRHIQEIRRIPLP